MCMSALLQVPSCMVLCNHLSVKAHISHMEYHLSQNYYITARYALGQLISVKAVIGI